MAFDAGAVKARMVLDKSKWHKSAQEVNTMKQKMAGQAKKTGMAFKGMWKQMAIGIGITGGITMVVRGLMRQMADTIKTGRDFEKEWANVTTMLNISRTATEKMKHELRMLSPTLGDTTELARGMYQVLSASIEPAKAIKFLGEAAKSAKAGVTETKIAVDGLTTVINAYGMEAEAVTEVSDIMFGTVKRGKLTYDELAQSLGTVVPVAATVGVNFRDVAAAIATLTRQGIVASKATMQLRQIFMAILKPSAEALEITEDLGIAMGKNALETMGLAGWLEQLKEKTKGNADIITKIIPNVRALTAGLALVGKAAEGYAHDQEFLAETMGFTDEAFRKQTETLDFWLETFKVVSKKIKEAIYEGLTASLVESIRTAEDFDEKVTQATNNAANSVSLHVSTMVEVFGKLKAEIDRQIGPLLWLKDVIIGTTKGTDKLAEAEERLRESLARAGIEQITTTELTHYAATAALTLEERFASMGRTAEFVSQTQLKTMDEQLAALIESMSWSEEGSDLLALKWEQNMSGMEENTLNFMASIIPGMAFMTHKVSDDFEEMGKNIKVSLSRAIGEAGYILSSMGQHSKALAYAGAVINTAQAVTKALSYYPPPISFVMAGLQAAAGAVQIAAISAQSIPSAEKGAYLPSPAIIEAGHGPMGEIVLPLDRAPAGIGGAKVDFNFYAPIISTTGLSDRDIDEVTEYFFDRMDSEARRRGYSSNG